MKAIQGIKKGLINNDSSLRIARKIYLSYSTEIFRENEDREFYIKERISEEFDIPFCSIQIAGSSKTGVSFFKNKAFEPTISDLDIAIISAPLYNKFVELVHKLTKGYTDLTGFRIFRGVSNGERFLENLPNGFINPFIMPDCEFKSHWLEFFNSLSNDHFDLFKGINGGVYASEYFFEKKQENCIVQYQQNTSIYDKISGAV